MNEESCEVDPVADLSPPEAKRFIEKLEEEGIPWDIETDDSAIKTLSPWQARMGGTFGAGVRILVFVAEEHYARARSLHDHLFPPPQT